MIILDSTTKSLIAYMGGAKTTNEPVFVVAYADIDGSVSPPILIEASNDGLLNDTSHAELVAAPASDHRRIIKSLTIYNADTVPQTIFLALLNGANARICYPPTVLAPGGCLSLGMDFSPIPAQALGAGDSPTFANLTDDSLAASQIVLTDAAKKLVSAGSLAGFLFGTAGAISAVTVDSVSTWTPSIGGSATYTTQTGTYVKIGRLVFITCHLKINVIGSGSTTVISGLPFVPSASQSIFVGYFSGIATSVYFVSGYVDTGSNINITSLAAADTGIGGSAIFKNAAEIYFSACYQTAS